MVALQSLGRTAARTTARTTTVKTTALAATRCYATELERKGGNENKLGRTFQGQVMGSIGSRLQREKEQRERYEHWRQVTDPSRNWTISFCASDCPWSHLLLRVRVCDPG